VKKGMKKIINFILVFCILIAGLFFVAAAEPSGATVNANPSTRASGGDPGNDTNAFAGNITELTVTGSSITQAWQGYFGNISGTIKLANSADNVMYNWSLASPEGEIYASNTSIVSWTDIQCYNETTNLSEFENMFGIGVGDVDGLNETFSLNNHPEFFTNNKQFGPGVCKNAKLYNNAAVGTFNEILLTDGPNLVFASLLLNDITGFDNVPHDFEMMVLENGHGNSDTETYYFWVELE
jgi:hypothetical protein